MIYLLVAHVCCNTVRVSSPDPELPGNVYFFQGLVCFAEIADLASFLAHRSYYSANFRADVAAAAAKP